MLEDQKSILAWSVSTFGPRTLEQVLVRTLDEVVELIKHVHDGETDKAIKEVADCGVMFAEVAELVGRDMARQEKLLKEHHTLIVQKDDAWPLATHVLGLGSRMFVDSCSWMLHGEMRMTLKALLTALGSERSLDELVTEKMKVNRARKWKFNDKGRAQHVEGT